MRKNDLREKSYLQFITHSTERYSYLDSVRLALDGGCRWIQLRMKEASTDEVESVAWKAKALCKKAGAMFIIDDHVELAKRIQADGVHLGKQDMPLAEAREILGSGVFIGATANTFDDIRKHHAAGADYIGCGPFRYTTTKQNLSPLLGLEGYRQITKRMQEASIRLPIIAIGGITKEDIFPLMQTGIKGIALSGAVLRAKNPIEEMRTIIKQMQTFNKKD